MNFFGVLEIEVEILNFGRIIDDQAAYCFLTYLVEGKTFSVLRSLVEFVDVSYSLVEIAIGS